MAETLVAAIRRGPLGVASLPGDNTFVVCEPERTLIARSCVGLGQWYVYESDHSVLAATHLLLVEMLLERTLPIDPLVMAASTTASVFPWNRSPLQGVRVLPPGHLAELRTGASTTFVRYWNPAEIEQGRPDPKVRIARELRREVLDALKRDLDDDRPNVGMLTGGPGSSIVVAAAARLGKSVHTSSVVPTRDYTNPDPTYAKIDGLIEGVRVNAHWSEHNESTAIDLRLSAPSTRLPISNPALIAAAHHANDAGADTVFGGAFARSLFGDWKSIFGEWIPEPPPWVLADGARLGVRLDRSTTSAVGDSPRHLSAPLPFAHELPRYIRFDLRAEYAQWIREVRVHLDQSPHPRMYTIGLLDYGHGELAQQWELFGALGLSVSVPFAHRRLVEMSFGCHPLDLVNPAGRQLLRAFGDVVPGGHLAPSVEADPGQSPAAGSPHWLIPDEAIQGLLELSQCDLTDEIPAEVASALAPLRRAMHRSVPHEREAIPRIGRFPAMLTPFADPIAQAS